MSSPQAEQDWIYAFGDVEVELRAHRLSRGGHAVAVEPKAYAVLVALLARAGEAVERDELLDLVWGHRHVTPGVLNRCIAQLRKALGDGTDQPRYIQTVHTLGYRFIGEVRRLPSSHSHIPTESGTAPPQSATTSSSGVVEPVMQIKSARFTSLREWGWAAGGAAVLAALTWLVPHLSASDQAPAIGNVEASTPRNVVIRSFELPAGATDLRPQVESLEANITERLVSLPGLRVTKPGHGADDAPASSAELSGTVRRNGKDWQLEVALRDDGSIQPWRKSYPLQLETLGQTATLIQQDVLGVLVPGSPLLPRAKENAQSNADQFVRSGERAMKDQKLQDMHDATSNFRRALEIDPANANAWCHLGTMHLLGYAMVLQSIEEVLPPASEAIQRGLRLDPASAICQEAQGRLFEAQGKKELAKAAYRRALALDPQRFASKQALATMELDGDNFIVARDMLKDLVAHNPERAWVHCLLINAYTFTGEVEAARAVERTLDEHLPRARNINWPGALLDIMFGRPASGIRREQMLAAADPDDRSYHLSAAITASQIGAVSLAAAENKKAGRLDTPHYLLANVWVFYALNDPEGALAWLKTAQAPPSIVLSQRALQAQSLALAGRRAEALQEYAHVYDAGYADADAAMANGVWIFSSQLLNWAALFPADSAKRRDIVDAAARHLSKLQANGLNIPWVPYQTAQIALLRGEYDKAMSELDEAIAAGFTDALALHRDLPWQQVKSDPRFRTRKARLDGIAAEQRRQLTSSLESDSTSVAAGK